MFGALLSNWAFLPLMAAATDTAGTAAGAPLFQWRPFLAPFHAVVLHFPIGFLTMAAILELYRLWRPSEEVRRVGGLILALGLATGVMSAGFGLMRAGSADYDARTLALHQRYGLSVPAATVLALVLHSLAGRAGAARAWTAAYRLSLAGTVGLVVVAGHYGGNLTHGSKYLVENAPAFVRALLEPKTEADAANASGPRVPSDLFQRKVRPILDSKCLACHGPDKQKGGYRVDQPDALFAGGHSDLRAVKPGDPIGSQLVRLILLPPHHDDVMPPEGKKQLTPDEVLTLIEWIRDGAHMDGESEAPAAPSTDR